MRRAIAFALLLGCGGEDADVAGDFSIAVTNRDNGCEFDNWMEDETSANIPVTITQDGSAVTATIEGLTGSFVEAVLGSRSYEGEVDGNDLFLELFGSRAANQGNCAFTINSEIDATISGDALEGRINYKAATNGNPDCDTLEGCVSFQDFNGTRPPQ